MLASPSVDAHPSAGGPAELPAEVRPAESTGVPETPGYVYAATDLRPRQRREIELCEKAAHFDWLYTSAAAGGVVAGIALNTQVWKQSDKVGVRMLGPSSIGLFWGLFLSGGYLSLPRCEPTWAYGAPPEGATRAAWPMATAIALLATVTAPAMDYAFLGPVKTEWEVSERSTRVFVAMGTGLAGSLLPYLLPPKPWAASREIERIRLGEVAGGPFVSYGFAF